MHRHFGDREKLLASARSSSAPTQRFASRGEDEFANQLLSALRDQFGGHEEMQ